MTFQNNEKFLEINNEVNPFYESMWTRYTPPIADSGPDQTAYLEDSLQRVVSESRDAVGDTLPFFLNFISHLDNRNLSSDRENDNEPDTVTTRGPDQAILSPLFVKFDGSGVGNLDVDLSEINPRLVSTPEGGTRQLLSLTSIINSSHVDADDEFILKINIAKTELDNDSAIILNANREIIYQLSYAISNNTLKPLSMLKLDGRGQLSLAGFVTANLREDLDQTILATIQAAGVTFSSPFPRISLFKFVFCTENDGESKFLNQSTGEYAVVGLSYVRTHGPLKEKPPGVAIVWRAPLPKTPKRIEEKKRRRHAYN